MMTLWLGLVVLFPLPARLPRSIEIEPVLPLAPEPPEAEVGSVAVESVLVSGVETGVVFGVVSDGAVIVGNVTGVSVGGVMFAADGAAAAGPEPNVPATTMCRRIRARAPRRRPWPAAPSDAAARCGCGRARDFVDMWSRAP